MLASNSDRVNETSDATASEEHFVTSQKPVVCCSSSNDYENPSNQTLLMFAAVSFLTFSIAEVFGALVSNSLSLLGDAATMIVDAMTYGLNMYAEYRKPQVSAIEAMRYELYAPLFSVVVLFGISIYVIIDAIETLTDDSDSSEEVNDSIMLGFALVNLIFDFLNMACFYRAQRLFGFPVSEYEGLDEDGDGATNTNMCSAYTHVLADTLRSIAVLLAAGASSLSSSIKSETADAWAAIFVSLIVFGSTFPLLKGLREKYNQIKRYQDDIEMDDPIRTRSLLSEA
mmetsp:Transcript_8414/g.10967  ORF Transcript_8414/g.10967 Transcript_8414/m.10967 type:complete len:285 (-) Transcript_8414:49-903(-)